MSSGWIIAAVVLGLMAIAILTDVAYRIYAASRIRHLLENVPPFGVIEDHREFRSDDVSIPLGEGRHLAASLYRPTSDPRGIIVFCHELDGNRFTAMAYTKSLVDSGFLVVSFDFGNHGESSFTLGYTPIHWITEAEVADLQAVIRWVKSDEQYAGLKLGLFGVSRGACAALIVASLRPDIQAVVTDSAYSTRSLIWSFTGRFSKHVCPNWFFRRLPDWHVWQDINAAIRSSEKKTGQTYVHLEDVVQGIRAEVLMIAGSRDSYVSVSVRDQLVDMLPSTAQLWLVPRAKHNRARQLAPEEYDSRIAQHFQDHFGNPFPAPLTCHQSTG